MEIIVAGVVADVPIPIFTQGSFKTNRNGLIFYVHVFLGIVEYIIGPDAAIAGIKNAHDAGFKNQITGTIRREFDPFAAGMPPSSPAISIRVFLILSPERITGLFRPS